MNKPSLRQNTTEKSVVFCLHSATYDEGFLPRHKSVQIIY